MPVRILPNTHSVRHLTVRHIRGIVIVMENTAIVYYSLDGNTDYIARRIAEKTGAKLVRLKTKRAYPRKGFKKFFIGGRDALFGAEPELKAPLPDLAPDRNIVIGTPVWASRPAPAMNTFLRRAKIDGKHIALFACSGGGQAETCFDKMQVLLAGNEILCRASFINPAFKRGKTVDDAIDEIVSALSD
ncbi:hypothetical protein HMPREF1221_01519 [Treponema socranskii subsp. paredis ATCC 35535]|nr:hypothetical protein HMPREF1221_01519 [Treponema socranskii subsp. paredis ATCC 35535]